MRSFIGWRGSYILPERYMSSLEVLHVMWRFHVVVHITFACAAESLYCIKFTFLKEKLSKSLKTLKFNLLYFSKENWIQVKKFVVVNLFYFMARTMWPTSILVASPPLTIGTVLPAWILYGAIECPFKFRILFTTITEIISVSNSSYYFKLHAPRVYSACWTKHTNLSGPRIWKWIMTERPICDNICASWLLDNM